MSFFDARIRARAVPTVLALCCTFVAEAGGLAVSDSRIILSNGQTVSGFVLANTSQSQFLTKVWVETKQGEETEDIMAVPPVAYSPPGKHVRFQVMLLHPEKYAKDKETLFYLRTHSVPGDGKSQHALTLAYDVKLKIFYRPEGLEGDMASAIEDLRWSLKKGELKAYNPSNYHVSIVTYGLNSDYTEVQDCVIPPGESLSFGVSKQYPEKVKVRWAAIDDYGSPIRRSTVIKNER